MGVDTKASDWFMAAHRLKVNPGASSGSLSFKIGSRVANQAALIGCAGAISGSGIPNEFFFGLDTVNMNIFGGGFSLRDIKGHIGDVHHNTSLVPGELSPTARRTNDVAVMFNAAMASSETFDFIISGQWMVKAVLKLGDTFIL